MTILNVRQIESRRDTAAGPQVTQDRVFRSERQCSLAATSTDSGARQVGFEA